MKPIVYFSREITPEKVLELYKLLDKKLEGNVAIKVHSGETGNQNFLRPAFWKPLIDHVGGTVVEANTAYEGTRNNTTKHLVTIREHGWNRDFDVEILDDEGPDEVFEIPNGKVIQKNYVGKNIKKYDSLLVLSHFKGHPMGGYGGALKQLSIGVASSFGKAYIHGSGEPEHIWDGDHDSFLESMADAASSIIDYFGKENLAYINVMNNLSIDCDCDSNPHEPEMQDIGIFASLDPVAIDKACYDTIMNSDDPKKDSLIERMTSRNAIHTVEQAYEEQLGNIEYEIINID